MKIGIITHHYVSNYGAFLQAWALRKAVSGMFPDATVQVVNWSNPKHYAINTAGCLRPGKASGSFAAFLQNARLPIVFSRARRKELGLTKRVRGAKGINKLAFDVLIVGSDEVWNYRDAKSAAALKFGCGLTAKRLIAYAPSVGLAPPFDDLPAPWAAGLKRFQALSARDDNTQALIEQTLGVTPARVFDPTFLTAIPGKSTPRTRALTFTPFLLLYHAPISDKGCKALRQYADERTLRLIGAGEYKSIYDEVSVDLDPFEWRELFQRAQFIITGTFHGAVFAILSGKPFAVLPYNEVRREKIKSLLAGFELDDRVIDREEDLYEVFHYMIDEPSLRGIIRSARQGGLEYLKQAIAPELTEIRQMEDLHA